MTFDIETRHCRALIAVADAGGIGLAARRLGVAQSTVSETLLSLERVLGEAVITKRAGRGAALNEAGQRFLPYARSMVSTSEDALAALAGRAEKIIRVGAVESISSFLLPEPIGEFRQLWPETEVSVEVGLCHDLRTRLEQSELDLTLTLGEASSTTRDGVEIARVRLLFVVAPDHPLARAVASCQDLAAVVFLLADAEGAFNAILRTWLAGGEPRLESAGTIDGVKRGVRTSRRVGVLPHYAVKAELRSGELVSLRTEGPALHVLLRLSTKERPRSNSRMATLIDRLKAAATSISDPTARPTG